MTAAAAPLSDPRSGGPGDGPEEILIGFVAEPIVDLAHVDAAPLYSECLARILVDGKVVLKPDAFVGELEASGDIGLLDAAMVSMVLDALEADPRAVLGCNISPGTLAVDSSWKAILRMIGGRSHLARRLVLEITENGPLDEIAGAPMRLARAQALGCRVAIDDFGAGKATIRHLQGVNVDWDIVKIDRSCLAKLRKTPSGREGLRSLFALASCLAPTVVVEGIETPEHLAAARAAGLRWGQGFFFSRPALESWTELDGAVGAKLGRRLSRVCASGSAARGSASRDDLVRTSRGSASDGLLERLRALLAHTWGGLG